MPHQIFCTAQSSGISGHSNHKVDQASSASCTEMFACSNSFLFRPRPNCGILDRNGLDGFVGLAAFATLVGRFTHVGILKEHQEGSSCRSSVRFCKRAKAARHWPTPFSMRSSKTKGNSPSVRPSVRHPFAPQAKQRKWIFRVALVDHNHQPNDNPMIHPPWRNKNGPHASLVSLSSPGRELRRYCCSRAFQYCSFLTPSHNSKRRQRRKP